MSQIPNQKLRPNSWYNGNFIQQFSVESPVDLYLDLKVPKSNHLRARSLSSRIESGSFQNDTNMLSTNQTSVEISVEEILSPHHDRQLPSTTKNASVVEKNIDFDMMRPLGNELYLADNYTLKKNFKPTVEETKNYKLKKFTPVLAAKQPKVPKENKPYEKLKQKTHSLAENKKKIQVSLKRSSNDTEINENKPKKNIVLDSGNKLNTKSFNKTFDLGLDIIKQNQNIKYSDDDQNKIKLNEPRLKKVPKIKILPAVIKSEKEKSSEAYCSPLKSVQKFSKPSRPFENPYQSHEKLPENPYQSHEITPELAQTLEELQKYLISSDSSYESSLGTSLDSDVYNIDYGHLVEYPRSQVREPSFGLGGGEFSYNEQQKPKSEPKYYELNLEQKEIEKNTQTEVQFNQIFAMVTDTEFIKSLKIIGQFANFIENSFNVHK